MNELDQYRKLARRIITTNRDVAQKPVTKIGGVPWWPINVPRPFCDHHHTMSFIAQFLLRDVPELGLTDTFLLSFHYCQSCAYDGRMTFGWTDAKNRGYDLRLFENPESIAVDHAGMLAESVVRSTSVEFLDVMDFPTFDDLPSELHDLAEYRCLDDEQEEESIEYKNIQGTKVGGWPSWVQNAEWPKTKEARMTFVAQIDWRIGRDTAWGGGGYSYLFVDAVEVLPRRAELSILTT